MTNRRGLLVLMLALTGSQSSLAAPPPMPMSAGEIDRLVNRTMAEFSIPGIAVGVVKDGQLVFAKGYGIRTLGQAGKIDPDTVFAIGSNTKAFTAAALAMLVDEGKLKWDDRVIDYLPDFRMWDPFVTREFTIRDLLTHRSGLGLGAGDLLFVTPTDFTPLDLLHALRYLKPVTSFRSEFAYDNLLYAVAGSLVPVASGKSWQDFVTARILAPLQMDGCAVAADRLKNHVNIASPHAEVDGRLAPVPALQLPLVAPAGSIVCNVTGLAKWVATQLAHGIAPDGQRLFSAAQGAEMWSAQTILRPAGRRAELTRTHLSAYGLGWGVEDFDGYLRVSHSGGLPGMVTHVSMIPELHLGVVVLTNQQQSAALAAVVLPILEAYAGAPKRDWVALLKAMNAEADARVRESDARRAPDKSAPAPANLQAFVGTFEDPWRGAATVARTAAGLELRFSHTEALVGELTPQGGDLFIVRWKDRSLNADAYVRFSEDFTGKVAGFTMQAVSASTDFSYDFQDLNFARKADPAAAGAQSGRNNP